MRKNRVWAVNSAGNLETFKKTDNKEKEKWWKRFGNWLIESLKSYCATTSMHGFNYTIREDCTPGERIAWILIVVSAIIVSLVLLWVSWNWNEETPTVTVIESTHFATWNIPFPAVTICNFNKLSLKKSVRYSKLLSRPPNVTSEELLGLFKLLLYYSGGLQVNSSDYSKLHAILTSNKLTAMDLLNELQPTCKDILFRCIWKGTQTRCDSLFQKINTTEGRCCSFNYYGLKKNNYPIKLAYTIPNVPRKVTGCGYQTGLTVLLRPGTRDYFGTYLSSYGFRVLIHDSANYPDENAETKVLTSATESFLSITPESTYATPDVRGLKHNVRKCLFYDERALEVLKSYSYINCLAECRTHLVFSKCGCVPANLPSNGSLPICNVNQISCVIRYREIFVAALPGMNDTIVRQKRPDKMPCDCLPDCELNQYPSEITSGTLIRQFSHSNVNLFKGVNITDEVLLHVYFNDLISTRYRKDIYQNWLATLASFGGLLGLIIGFSIVTGFEFIYYLTLRPLFDHFSKN